jgi:hypothetical protein
MLIKEWFKLLKAFISYTSHIGVINKSIKARDKKSKRIRKANFPSELSENLVRFAYFELFKISLAWKPGLDLKNSASIYEVKGFVNGPITFGSTKKFNTILFLDASCYIDGIYTLYIVNCSDLQWYDLCPTKYQTFKDFIVTGKRPRCIFKNLLVQFRKKQFDVTMYNVTVCHKKSTIKVNQIFFPF